MENQSQQIYTYRTARTAETFARVTEGKSEEFRYAVFAAERILALSNLIRVTARDPNVLHASASVLESVLGTYLDVAKLDPDEVLSAAEQVYRVLNEDMTEQVKKEREEELGIDELRSYLPPNTTLQ